MKKMIIKKVWFAAFALFLMASSQQALGQTTDSNATNANHVIAADYDVTAYSYGTFDVDGSFVTLNAELDNMKSSYDTKEYRYYWLVAVDSKRFNIALEDALLTNLVKVSQEFGSTNAAIQELYNNTVNMLQ